MTQGKIKFYNTEKMYGFVLSDETKEEFYFHGSELTEISIDSDERVTFDVAKSKFRPGSFCAINIRKIEGNEKN